ncbi:MAG: TetR/AcrR family transcriptional regulator [Acidimicrobiia bacterium]
MTARLPASERREQLFAVALEAFAARGFHATSMSDIADAAGVTKPVLYQHFTSKHELYRELLEDVGDRLMSGMWSAFTGAETAREQVEAGLVAYFRFVQHDHHAFALLFSANVRRDDEFSETVKRCEDAIASMIAPLITADIDESHRLLLAYSLVGMAETASRRLVANKLEFEPTVVARQLADLAWAGLRGIHRV